MLVRRRSLACMKALVIVPTYNERENLARLVPAILAQAEHLHVLIVDDNSPDGTGQIADGLAETEPRVNVLHRAGKRGLGTAYVAGFKWALDRGFDYVFEMDADFSHDPADLPRLLAAAMAADVAVGSRWVAGGGTANWSLLRTLISRGGSVYAKLILGVPVNDLTSGFKCFASYVLQSLDLDSIHSNGYAFQVELNYRCHRLGFKIAEVPIMFVDRRVGKSKMSPEIVVEAMGVVWKLRLTGAPADHPPAKYSRIPPA
ncbi:MAG: polyprenol monophosphomannose synthase [Chloroflexi bacterium]|nr:polyprenol monophosphomannose synthase [Chloroflexota bacterium]